VVLAAWPTLPVAANNTVARTAPATDVIGINELVICFYRAESGAVPCHDPLNRVIPK
jgi:hypothetical protein